MAEKKDDKKGGGGGGSASDSDVIMWLVGIVIAGIVISGFLRTVKEKFGITFEDGVDIVEVTEEVSEIIQEGEELPAGTPYGTLVEAVRGIDIWSDSNKSTVLGEQEEGSIGRIITGPVLSGEESLWNVDFEVGIDGWAQGEDIKTPGFSWRRLFAHFRTFLLWFSAIISVIALAGAIYSWRKLQKLEEEHKSQMRMLEQKLVEDSISEKNERWEQVCAKGDSENPGDWRLAIIEADIMLDELISSMGYTGAGIGEKLKRIEKSDFGTIDLAWEAHKTRNRIAHEGTDFILTQREARRIIDLYRQVFEEFDYI